MTLEQEYEQKTVSCAGQFETVPFNPNKVFFYTREYVKWLERKVNKLRKSKNEKQKPDKKIKFMLLDKNGLILQELVPVSYVMPIKPKKLDVKKFFAVSFSWYDSRGLRHTKFLTSRQEIK